ncbi:hypothetical protein BD310DRAFT_910908 [Dichomitus squalens]|uniref:Uncharacterized protein n=1 Tax=Dichomitus squalens TaxID=114155 RepID=A0A4Q9P911_9APHY|nr:hypothetical protein BD310DRAFT_910908 [Dichomitus squalens]
MQAPLTPSPPMTCKRELVLDIDGTGLHRKGGKKANCITADVKTSVAFPPGLPVLGSAAAPCRAPQASAPATSQSEDKLAVTARSVPRLILRGFRATGHTIFCMECFPCRSPLCAGASSSGPELGNVLAVIHVVDAGARTQAMRCSGLGVLLIAVTVRSDIGKSIVDNAELSKEGIKKSNKDARLSVRELVRAVWGLYWTSDGLSRHKTLGSGLAAIEGVHYGLSRGIIEGRRDVEPRNDRRTWGVRATRMGCCLTDEITHVSDLQFYIYWLDSCEPRGGNVPPLESDQVGKDQKSGVRDYADQARRTISAS